MRRSSPLNATHADPNSLRAVIGLGGNIEPRLETLRLAIERLDETAGVRVAAVSSVYESEPWGLAGQPDFLNAAALIETSLAPAELLEALLGIEAGLGRDRSAPGPRWGPRPIDLDILLIPGRVVSETGLEVPHPRLSERDFALRPLLEVLPEAVDPRDGVALRERLTSPPALVARLFAPPESLLGHDRP
jgi:2-amino-4-hydroxy-6-hydroxymethyldihydropteridine diphosphokinase